MTETRKPYEKPRLLPLDFAQHTAAGGPNLVTDGTQESSSPTS